MVLEKDWNHLIKLSFSFSNFGPKVWELTSRIIKTEKMQSAQHYLEDQHSDIAQGF